MVFALNTKPVQNFIVHKVASYISNKIGTSAYIDEVSISFFNQLELKGVFLEDQNKDTLLWAKSIDLKLNNFFFLKDEIIIKSIALDNVNIQLIRSKNSEEWNYQFIADSFNTNNQTNNKTQDLPHFQLEQIVLNNVKFNYIDAWVGLDYYFQTKHFEINGDAIDYKNKLVKLKEIRGDSILVGNLDYTGGRPPRARIPFVNSLENKTPFNPNNWHFEIDKINISNSRFFLEFPEKPIYANTFSELHLDIRNINTNIENINIEGDTITGNVLHLSAYDRCGLSIKDFRSIVTVSPNISECKNLYLKTDNSELRDYYAMHYRHFPDFLEYIERVKMVGNFKDAKIGINDILYFTDAITRIKDHQFYLSGKGVGTVDDLKATEIVLSDGINTYNGDFAIKNIPHTEHLYMKVDTGFITGVGAAAENYLPEIDKNIINIANIGQFQIACNFDGVLDDFKSKIILNSNIGNVKSDIKMMNAYSKTSIYSASFDIQDFNLGQLINNNKFGNITSHIVVEGEGLDNQATHFAFNALIPSINFQNYNYTNSEVYGTYQNRSFSGTALSTDTNFNIDINNGKITFEDEITRYTFDAKIHNINTHLLHLTEHKLKGNGDISINFSGNHIDNFIGSILFYNMDVKVNEQPLNLKQFYLNATQYNNIKNFSFLTNGIDAYLNGDVTISTLLPTLKKYFHRYFPSYFNEVSDENYAQNFNFTINTKVSDDFFKFVNLPIKLNSGTNIKGNFNSIDNDLNIIGTIPYIGINDFNFSNGTIDIKGNNNGLTSNININKFNYIDYEIASALNLNTTIIDGIAQFELKTESDNTLGSASIKGNVQATNDSLWLHLASSNILFNHKNWNISSNDKISITSNAINIPQVILNADKQIIQITSKPNNTNLINIALKDVELNPLNNFFNWTDFTINGKLNGNVLVNDILNKQSLAYHLMIDTLKIDNLSYGFADIYGNADLKNQYFTIESPSKIQSSEGININFTCNASYAENDPYLEGNILTEQVPLQWIAPFIKEYVYDLRGIASAKIRLSGSLLQPTYHGIVNIKDAKVIPYVTNVPYYINEHQINVTPSSIAIRNLEVLDDYKRKGWIDGTIKYSGWENYHFDLHFNSPDIQLLALEKNDNEYYYGNIHGKVDVDLFGPIDNIKFNVTGKPLAGSKLFIPINADGDYTTKDYISFKKPINIPEKKTSNKRTYNYNLKLDAIGTPDLEAFILLDEATGDNIQAKGYGNITMEIPSNGEITLNGNYSIEEGEYNFAFKQLEVFNLKKRFIIEQGSTIRWDGNLYDADLNVKANTQVRARLYDLIMNETDRISLSQQEITDAQLAQPINIHLDMNGALSKPELSFRIDLVENRSIGSYAYQKLQRINTTEAELLNQVAGLLILNQFLPSEGVNNSSISAGAITNMSEVISATASSQISNLANKIMGWEDLYINVKYKNYALSGYDITNPTAYINRNEAGVNVRKNFFNNRLVTEIGGIYDWGNNNTNYNLAGEFKLEYLLTKDGRIRLNAFRTSRYDAIFQQNVNRQGAGILYKKSFSNINELLSIKKQSSKSEYNSVSDTTNK